MRATIRDAYKALSLRNIAIFTAIVIFSYVLIDLVGYIVWRRFPIPTLIISVAILGWKIGRKIGHAGLAKLMNAASVGLGVFGIILWTAAVLDAQFFVERGYLSWATTMVMWAWITFHVWRAWDVLRTMPPDKLIHVTEGTEAIYAQMTYRAVRAQEALDAYQEATKYRFVTR